MMVSETMDRVHGGRVNTPVWSRRDVWTRKLLYPGHTLPTALAPVVVASALAYHDRVFAPGPALIALLVGWLIQFAGVVMDNYQNLVDQPNDREHPELVDAVTSGLLTLSGLKSTILACYGLALSGGVVLGFLAGWPVVPIGLAAIGASYAYSAGPYPIGRWGLADPLFFVFFGVVSVVGTYYVEAASRGAVEAEALWRAFLVSLPVGALATSILIIDDIRDRDFDRVKGKRTVAVRFGPRWSRAEYVALQLLAYVLPYWLLSRGTFTRWVLLPWISLPVATRIAHRVCTRDDFIALVPMTPRAARLALAYALLLGIGLLSRG
jgi:1,4-dihydroxy-2-naphthoate octaprenyltransferase